jgi:hypothetical protein
LGPGHLGVGFAAKRLAPKAPLWSLLAASVTPDLLRFGFKALGLEKPGIYGQKNVSQGIEVITTRVAPWSHGLFMSVIWAVLFALIAYSVSRDLQSSSVLGLAVFSHWVLDFIVHPPDMPLLFENSPSVGLGLWTTGPGYIASIILEGFLLIGGITIYLWGRKQMLEKSKKGQMTAV